MTKLTESIDWKLLLSKLEVNQQSFKPNPELEPYIFPIVYGDLYHPEAHSMLFRPIPTGNIILYIRFHTPVIILDGKSLASCSEPLYNFVVGIYKLENLHYIKTLGRIANFVVAFKPGGFHKLFNRPASDVQNKIVDLSKIVKADFMQQINKLKSLPTVGEQANALMMLLTQTLPDNSAPRNRLPEVVQQIRNKKGTITIKELCNSLNMGIRSLQRAFLTDVGTSPKEYMRIIRFNHVLEKLVQNNFENWHEIIFELGYFDQSHFINDFKSVVGMTPAEFIHTRQTNGSIFLERFGLLKYVPDLKTETLMP